MWERGQELGNLRTAAVTGVGLKLSSDLVPPMVRQGPFQMRAWKAVEGPKGKELDKVTQGQ